MAYTEGAVAGFTPLPNTLKLAASSCPNQGRKSVVASPALLASQVMIRTLRIIADVIGTAPASPHLSIISMQAGPVSHHNSWIL